MALCKFAMWENLQLGSMWGITPLALIFCGQVGEM